MGLITAEQVKQIIQKVPGFGPPTIPPDNITPHPAERA
jgi:hypothetical protein